MKELLSVTFRQTFMIVYVVLLLLCITQMKELYAEGDANLVEYEEGMTAREEEDFHFEELKEMKLSPLQLPAGWLACVLLKWTGWPTKILVGYITKKFAVMLSTIVALICLLKEKKAAKIRSSLLYRQNLKPDEKKKGRRKGVAVMARAPYSMRSFTYTVVMVLMAMLGMIFGHQIMAMMLALVLVMIIELGYLIYKQYRGEIPRNTPKDVPKKNVVIRNVVSDVRRAVQSKRRQRGPRVGIVRRIKRLVRGY